MQANPAALGGGPAGGPDGGAKVAAHAFFASPDWDALLRRQLPSTLGKADSEPALSDGESRHVAAEFRSFDVVGEDTRSTPMERLGSPRTLGRSSPRNEASRSPSNGPGGRRLPPSAAVPSFTVSEDCRIWAISFELSRILGLDSSATLAPHLLLGRSARAILLPPYHRAFEGALENVLRAHAGGAADEPSTSQTVSIGVAGSSGASLMLHGSLHVATVEPGDVSNLFASSAHLAVKTLVRFAADKCTLLASVNPLSGLTPRGGMAGAPLVQRTTRRRRARRWQGGRWARPRAAARVSGREHFAGRLLPPGAAALRPTGALC